MSCIYLETPVLAISCTDTRHDWVGKVILQELCKKLKFDHNDRWYMRKPEMRPWDFKIYKWITRKADFLLIYKIKKNLSTSGFYRSNVP